MAPFNVHVVKELCKIYVQLNEIEAAVLLFEGIMDADRTIPLPKDLDEERENRRKRKQAKKKSKGKAVATGDMDADEEEEENGDDFDDEFEDDADEFFNVGDLEDGDDDDELVIGQTGPTAANRFRMGFQELHMLAELYMELREFAKCIHAIKEGVRRLHGRSCCEDDDAVTAAASSSSVIGLQSNSITGIMDDFQPMFTGAKFDADLTDLDREFDDQDLLEASPGNAVPLDIRVQMGICRLHLDQITVAQVNIST